MKFHTSHPKSPGIRSQMIIVKSQYQISKKSQIFKHPNCNSVCTTVWDFVKADRVETLHRRPEADQRNHKNFVQITSTLSSNSKASGTSWLDDSGLALSVLASHSVTEVGHRYMVSTSKSPDGLSSSDTPRKTSALSDA